MSSVQSAFAQVGPREKYLVVTILAASLATGQAVTVKPTFTVSSSMTATEWAAATTGATPVAAALYRDVGKTVTVYNPTTNLAVEKFVAAQLVSGAATEGISAAPIYLRVWAADPLKLVAVSRTG